MIGLHVGAHHGLGRTTHMHEDERRVFFFGNGKHVGITRSRRNIVDDIGSRVKGVRKMIYQTAWRERGEIRGLVEISMELPDEMPHYIRK